MMYFDKLVGALEAVLFAAGEPLSVAEIADYLHIEKSQVWNLFSALKKEYENETRGLMLREVNGKFQLVTKPAYYEYLTGLCKTKEIKLSNAAMETLSIIALKQPVTRAEIENIRGVKAEKVVNTLLDLELITEAGRKKSIGNPILYATTDKFLTVFGLTDLNALPMPDVAADEISEENIQQELLTKE